MKRKHCHYHYESLFLTILILFTAITADAYISILCGQINLPNSSSIPVWILDITTLIWFWQEITELLFQVNLPHHFLGKPRGTSGTVVSLSVTNVQADIENDSTFSCKWLWCSPTRPPASSSIQYARHFIVNYKNFREFLHWYFLRIQSKQPCHTTENTKQNIEKSMHHVAWEKWIKNNFRFITPLTRWIICNYISPYLSISFSQVSIFFMF